MSRKKLVDKSYERCLYCDKRRREPSECNGPRTSSMDTPSWRQYMRDLKSVEDLTYEDLSVRTGGQLSAATIQNVLAPAAVGDVTREKARLIENAIFGGAVAPPCPFDFAELMSADSRRVMAVEEEMAKLRDNISVVHDSYDREIAVIRAEHERAIKYITTESQKKIDYLLAENQRLHRMIDRLLQK